MFRVSSFFGLLGLLACGTPDGNAGVEGDQAGECSDGIDNDGDGSIDCVDPTCAPSADCASSTLTATGTGAVTGTGSATGSGTQTDCNSAERWIMTMDFGWDDLTGTLQPYQVAGAEVPPTLNFNYASASWDGDLTKFDQYCSVSYDISHFVATVPSTGFIRAFQGEINADLSNPTPATTNCYEHDACLHHFPNGDPILAVENWFQFDVALDWHDDVDLLVLTTTGTEPTFFGGQIQSDAFLGNTLGGTPTLGVGWDFDPVTYEINPSAPLRPASDSVSGTLTNGVYSITAPIIFGWSL